MKLGQFIAIPVLTRHIETSSGKCSAPYSEGYASNCVMADALRDRFPGAKRVDVSNATSTIDFADGSYVELRNDHAMSGAISDFDDVMNKVVAGIVPLDKATRAIRKATPRVVHATVRYIEGA